MVESLTSIFSAFGLSASAGLNAYLPLLIVALTARYTDWFQLSPPFDALKSPWAIGVLVVLLIVETVADKVPAVNHLNDLIQTVVRPTAGAVLFAGGVGVGYCGAGVPLGPHRGSGGFCDMVAVAASQSCRSNSLAPWRLQ
ncbi:MAG: DUF4126 domain-containing protein [Chloroflexi bacterium]|nr:DUF4126 domain-containing protein [Chloroflexota bacterium]